MRTLPTTTLLLLLFAPAGLRAQSQPTTAQSQPAEEPVDVMSAGTFAGLKLRSLGPALSSGRIGDFAVNPSNPAHYFVAVASGGVWKTTNAGTTWTPVFDDQGAFSIGCVTMDPHNAHVVWVGTGENNSQRSVAFGDGVYKSLDGGKNWTNVGLKDSEHIGMIAIDPRDSDVVYVAAQGPLWRSGGDRGLYKTTDGGQTWERILHISDDTGVNEVHLDPRDPDVLYASSYQRRRHVWTLINGGPEGAIYKSTDAGKNWRKLTKGIPDVDLGRIGLDLSPANPDVIYAIIEAADGKSGFFRSLDRGETWEKRSDYTTTSPQYYNEIVCDPLEVDRVYALDTILHVTEDGGKSLQRMPRENRHVDDHALWINPKDNNHLIVGSDGGIYETYDRGAAWRYMPNLPVTQFYRVSADNSVPFYYVYGGTQDNSSVGGPSRTIDRIGVANEHWFVTVGGDGYKTQVDPDDPNIVYSQWQYGGLVRHDRRSGEVLDIKPREAPGDEPYRWNWNTPFIISPHNPKRLYFAANILFRSDDGGLSWQKISGDLTRQLSRDALEIMGRVWVADAVAKHWNTSFYGNCVSLSESPLLEGLIYVGTDDGLIQITEDGGRTWRKVEQIEGIPDLTYVSSLLASQHEPHTVYATFDNHKKGDFKPYVLKSTDRGRTWKPIAGDLPERHFAHSFAEDHMNPKLLFAGTEFGCFFTIDGGTQWIKLKGGMPIISVRDIDIQERENDLVLGTFGRGIYILDNYTPLRHVNRALLEQDVLLFPVKDALRYIETGRLRGGNGKGSQGASYYAAENPPYGAVFTYYLKDKLKTRKEQRHEAEKDAIKKGETPPYPSIEDLRAEQEEQTPAIVLEVRDADGEVVRRIEGPRDKGLHRVTWDLRYPARTPVSLRAEEDRAPWWTPPSGPLALPGTYTVSLAKRVHDAVVPLADPQTFNVIPLELATFAAQDRDAVLAFHQMVSRLRRAVEGASRAAGEAQERIDHVRAAVLATPPADSALLAEVEQLDQRLRDLILRLRGDALRDDRQEPRPPSIGDRVNNLVGQWDTTSPPTETHRRDYQHAGQEFSEVLPALRTLMEQDLRALEAKLEDLGAPWTPGRIPTWKTE